MVDEDASGSHNSDEDQDADASISDQEAQLPSVENVAMAALPAYFAKFESAGLKKKVCHSYTKHEKVQAVKFMTQPQYKSTNKDQPNFYKVAKIGATNAERWWKQRDELAHKK